MKEKQLRSSYSASNSSQEELDGKSVEELYREEECTDGSTRRDRQNLLDENADYQDQSIERVRHNLLQHLLKLFSSEGPLEPPSPVAAAAMAASKMDLNVR